MRKAANFGVVRMGAEAAGVMVGVHIQGYPDLFSGYAGEPLRAGERVFLDAETYDWRKMPPMDLSEYPRDEFGRIWIHGAT